MLFARCPIYEVQELREEAMASTTEARKTEQTGSQLVLEGV